MPADGDFIRLIASLEDAPAGNGVRLVDQRFRESSISWHGMLERVLAQAVRYEAAGVGKGQKVLIALPTEIESVVSLLALVWLGAVPLSISSPLLGQDREAHRRHIVNLIRLHGVDRLVASRDLAGIAGSAPEAPAGMEIPSEPAGGGDGSGAPDATPASVDPDETAFVQFSSGSTSRPKGVRITHRNLSSNLRMIVENDGRTSDSVMVSWLPLYHDMGFVGCLLSNLLHGNDLVLMHPLCFMIRPVTWLDAVSKHGGTVTAVPNFALDHCLDRVTDEQMEEREIDLSTFRYIYDGAEPVRPASVRRFEERFSEWGLPSGSVHPVYGMSETTLIFSAPGPGEALVTREIGGVEVASVGFPLGDLEASVRDEAGEELGSGRIGEIRVRGSSVTPGYLSPAGGEGDGLEEGWLPTGDLGLLDEEGRLYITGRIKDLIIHQGRNYHGHDIAGHLETVPGVRRGKVYVFETEVEGSGGVVVMTVPPEKVGEAQPDAASFRADIVRAVLREFGLPVHDVCIVPRIPKTTSGKVVRPECERLYRESAGRR